MQETYRFQIKKGGLVYPSIYEPITYPRMSHFKKFGIGVDKSKFTEDEIQSLVLGTMQEARSVERDYIYFNSKVRPEVKFYDDSVRKRFLEAWTMVPMRNITPDRLLLEQSVIIHVKRSKIELPPQIRERYPMDEDGNSVRLCLEQIIIT